MMYDEKKEYKENILKLIRRSQGDNIVKIAAHFSGERITYKNPQTKKKTIYDGSNRKNRIIYSNIEYPNNAMSKHFGFTQSAQRENLWNNVEKEEKLKNSVLGEQCQLVLPDTKTDKQTLEICKEFTNIFLKRKNICDINLHKYNNKYILCLIITRRAYFKTGNKINKYNIRYTKKEREKYDDNITKTWTKILEKYYPPVIKPIKKIKIEKIERLSGVDNPYNDPILHYAYEDLYGTETETFTEMLRRIFHKK